MPTPTGPRFPGRLRLSLGLLRSLLLCAVALGLSAQSRGAGTGGDAPPVVFATVVPVAAFVERIGGAEVTVQSMVRPGQNPHTYEPTPRQVAALAGADLYVRVGMPLEDAWLPRIRATNPRMRILDARDGIQLRSNGPVSELDGPPVAGEGDHDPQAQDIHVWTSPPLAKSMGAAIRDALIQLRPGQAAIFQSNDERFAADLDALDADLRTRLAPVEGRRFMVFHPAWGYFADRYGLVQVAVEVQGKEPGARALAGLIAAARADGIRLVLVQPEFSARSAGQVAAAIGGRVESVDNLSADYFGNLRRLADLIVDADPYGNKPQTSSNGR
jgi:zinc transport system substrate-binding protein